ncbi:MAG: MipA/OmpV family protein [Alphaproteobacteria bacterium]|nr:MipA/OmpV family protein [Alphaproteobacteria bacterium]
MSLHRSALKVSLCTMLAGAALAPAHADILPPGEAREDAAAEAAVSDWKIVLGGGVALVPEYEGGDELEVSPFPLVSISWRDFIFLDGRGLGINVIHTKDFQVGAAIGYAPGREEDDAEILRGLGDIDPAARAQIFASYSLGFARLRASVSRDLGGSEGTQAELGLQSMIPVSDDLRLTGGVSATWADDAYMESYFGVTPTQSLNSGLPIYEAGAGFKRADVSVGLIWNMTETWFVRSEAKVGYLFGDAADSPITQNELQPSFMVGLGYRF